MIYRYENFGTIGMGLSIVGNLKRNHMLGPTIKAAPGLVRAYMKGSNAKKKELKAALDTKFEKEHLKNPSLTYKDFMKKHKESFQSGYRSAGLQDLINSAVGSISSDMRNQGYNQSKKEIRGLSKENERLKKQLARLQARG